MPARFKQTIDAFEGGIDKAKPAAGVKLIEAWEKELEGAEFPGVKGIVRDLGALKKALEGDTPDDEKIHKLLAKLGAATTKSAAKAEKTGDKLEALGQAMTDKGGVHEDDDDDDDDDDDMKAKGKK